MPSPLFNALGGQAAGGLGDMAQLVSRFQQFENSFRGNPQQMVQQLLNSGQMSQQEYSQLAQMATQFQQFLK